MQSEYLPHERYGNTARMTEIFSAPSFDPTYWDALAAPGLPVQNPTPNVAFTAYHNPGSQYVPNARSSNYQASSAPLIPNSRATTAPTWRDEAAWMKAGAPHFDSKLKVELIEEWDGDTRTILDWIESINQLAERSPVTHSQLGMLVPTRFRKNAKSWWTSLPIADRNAAQANWSTLRAEIARYFMSRNWFDKRKLAARECRYRDADAPRETPSQYYIRKYKLLSTASDYSDAELIMAIMDGAPKFWRSHIDTMSLRSVRDLQDKIAYHEDSLMGSGGGADDALRSVERRIRNLEMERERRRAYPPRMQPRVAQNVVSREQGVESEEEEWSASANLIGGSKTLPKPQFPKDDANVSKKATPESKGARPCRHCGSGKHWDNECKYAKKTGKRVARANLVSIDEDDEEADLEYEDAYQNASERDDDDGEIDEDAGVTLNY